MKARTKLEKKVDAMIGWLPPLTQTQRDQMNAVAFGGEYKIYLNKHGVYTCMGCGNRFGVLNEDGTCPHCGRKLKVEKDNKYTQKMGAYMCLSQMVNEEFQVFRFFLIRVSCKRGQTPQYDFLECWQKWLRYDGQWVVASRNRGFSYIYDTWSRNSEISLKKKNTYNYYGANYQDWDGYGTIYDGVIPTAVRNGFDETNLQGLSDFRLMRALLTTPMVETFYKQGMYHLVDLFISGNLTKAQTSAIKVALRHKYYDVTNKLWLDMISFLSELGYDYRNPHYICPADLYEAHDRYMKEVENKRKREAEEQARLYKIEQIRKAEADKKNYVERCQKFFDLDITDGALHIQPLKSVDEFVEEADEMHHCVLRMAYYNKPSSLILSAKINGKRIETIEVNLVNYQVAQCYGACNQFTPFHDSILNLMKANMDEIKRINTGRIAALAV